MRAFYLLPIVPATALALMPFLPFVDTGGLWLGMPKMLVWGGFWCVMLTPALVLVERMMARRGEDH